MTFFPCSASIGPPAVGVTVNAPPLLSVGPQAPVRLAISALTFCLRVIN